MVQARFLRVAKESEDKLKDAERRNTPGTEKLDELWTPEGYYGHGTRRPTVIRISAPGTEMDRSRKRPRLKEGEEGEGYDSGNEDGSELTRIGSFGVDGGTVWFGDPSYFIEPDDPTSFFDDLNNLLDHPEQQGCVRIALTVGSGKKEGVGVWANTLHGDGELGVWGRFERNGSLITELLIRME